MQENQTKAALNRHSVFESPEDYYDWNKYVLQLDLIDLTESDRTRARSSILYLRDLFGEKFLRRSHHPFRSNLINSAPMARLGITRLADSLKLLENVNSFKSLVKRLKDKDRYVEAVSVIDGASNFFRAGFDIDLDRTAMVKASSGNFRLKTPDIMLTDPDSKQVLFVEVSALEKSAQTRESEFTFNTIWRLLYDAMSQSMFVEVDSESKNHVFHHIRPAAVLHRDITKQELASVATKIKELVREVTLTNEFRELSFPALLDIGISPLRDHTLVENWAKLHGVEDLLQGPPLEIHDIHRARVKIGTKIRQLPRDVPGIILIPITQTLLFYTRGWGQIVAEVESELWNYPQLYAVILTSVMGETALFKPVSQEINEHSSFAFTRYDSLTERRLIIRNKAFDQAISDSALRRITEAFFRTD